MKIVSKLLKKYQISPSKGLGQNFLIDKGAVRKIIAAAGLGPEDVILEIGPGLGALTLELAKRVKKVIAVEKDPNLARIMNKELKIIKIKNVKIIQGDILRLTTNDLRLTTGYKVVANLPFYLTAPAIRKFLESVEVKPRQLVLIVQREVAQRICAKVPDMNLLAVSVQFYAQPKIISYVSKKSFWPKPKVDSAIVKITPFAWTHLPPTKNLVGGEHFASRRQASTFRMLFFKIVKAGFSQPRKQILNNLSKMLKLEKEKTKAWLLKNNIQPNQRAETLEINNWLKLTSSFPFQNFVL